MYSNWTSFCLTEAGSPPQPAHVQGFCECHIDKYSLKLGSWGPVSFVIPPFSWAASLSCHGTILDSACRRPGFSFKKCLYLSCKGPGLYTWPLELWRLPHSLSTWHLFIHSTDIYWATQSPGSVLGARDTTVNKTQTLPSHHSQTIQKAIITMWNMCYEKYRVLLQLLTQTGVGCSGKTFRREWLPSWDLKNQLVLAR